MAHLKDSQDLKIPLTDILTATENFKNVIGKGGYGSVYKGQLSLSGKLTTVAVKRLEINTSSQGFKEFLTEIQLLSRYKHPNLVSLLGFCDEDNEKILIYEYAERGSLDKYLSMAKTMSTFTWKRWMSICIDAAQGLDYLHNRVALNHRIIHRDIKSGNILLDHNLKAMIADFGLSKIGRANECITYVITNVSGTYGYCDPSYMDTGVLTKDSDTYSFGVVLFEVLCGRLCFKNVHNESRFLNRMAPRYYEKGKLIEIINPVLKHQMYPNSLDTFSEIAYQCLLQERDKRPSMGQVVEKLKEALEFHEFEEALGLQKLLETLQRQEFEEMYLQELEEALGLQELVKTLQRQEFDQEPMQLQVMEEALKLQIGESRMVYEVLKSLSKMTQHTPLTRKQFWALLADGILVDEDKLWLSIDDNGYNHEMISAAAFIPLSDADTVELTTTPTDISRFSVVACIENRSRLNMNFRIRSQFLSPEVTYAAYLVYKCKATRDRNELKSVSLKYRLQDTSETFISYSGDENDDGWVMFELFQTINSRSNAVDFEVCFEKFSFPFYLRQGLIVEGIKILPVHKFNDDETENSEVGYLPISTVEWDSHLPTDYKRILRLSYEEIRAADVISLTKQEVYSILSRGLLLKGNIWFWITKSNGKKCFMVQPEVTYSDSYKRKPSNESRFGNVLELIPSDNIFTSISTRSDIYSANTSYGSYLVYNIQEDLAFETPLCFTINGGSSMKFSCGVNEKRLVYLSVPQVPVIGPNGEMRSHNSMNRLKTIDFPKKRKDGWWEVKLANGTHANIDMVNNELVIICFYFLDHSKNSPHLTVHGIEFRPIENIC